MRSQLLLVPAAVVAAVATPATAKVYMDVAAAQQLLFPGATFSQDFVTLDQNEFNAVIKDSDINVYSRDIKAWRVSTGGWFIVDQVRGKDDWISYAIAVDAQGVVRNIEILECLDNYSGITLPAWRAQFYGKKRGSRFDDIQIISGSTLSSSQIAAGVKRVLSTIKVVLEPRLQPTG
jgi:hypothetical protein